MRLITVSISLLILIGSTFAQNSKKMLPKGWHLADYSKDSLYGISLDKAYDFFHTKNLKSSPVVVAVIDSGIDTTHEDLKSVLWINKKEIPGNGIDDDGNGYIDDINGWNFLGSRDGKMNVSKDSYEGARVYHKYKSAWEQAPDTNKLTNDDKYLYNTWLRARKEFVDDFNPSQYKQLKLIQSTLRTGDSIVKIDLNKEEYSGNDIKKYKATKPETYKYKMIFTSICNENANYDITNKELLSELENDLGKMDAAVTPPPSYRDEIVKDNYADINDKFYGNGNVYAIKDDALHGTHVAGIIAADRTNNTGIKGVADNVKIMALRAVPNGDEHDKDVALAIRYAVDNGARVINMSFGKSYSPEKKWVDDAVKYAEAKGVLLVHAAGNDATNVDTVQNFPCPQYLDGKGRASNWITVGASGDFTAGGLVADFSNYGAKEVDVFAPGVQIYSTVPGGNNYKMEQGTSMAAPVVTGIAALLLQYFPYLTPQQVKASIENTAVKPAYKVQAPGNKGTLDLSEISKTGGIVNIYGAAQYAATIKPATTSPQQIPVKIIKPQTKKITPKKRG